METEIDNINDNNVTTSARGFVDGDSSATIDSSKIRYTDSDKPVEYEISYANAKLYEIQDGRAVAIKDYKLGDIVTVVKVREDKRRLYLNSKAPLQFVNYSHAKPYVPKTLTEQATEVAKYVYNWVSINPIKASIGAALMFVGAGIFVSRMRQRIRNKKN